MKRHQGSMKFVYSFRDGLPTRTILRSFDKLAMEMENGILHYALEPLTLFARSRVTAIKVTILRPYDPILCASCKEPHDDKWDALFCCDVALPGETEDQRFRRVIAPDLKRSIEQLEMAVEFVPEYELIPYDIATKGIVLEKMAA